TEAAGREGGERGGGRWRKRRRRRRRRRKWLSVAGGIKSSQTRLENCIQEGSDRRRMGKGEQHTGLETSREDNTGSGDSLPLSPTLRRTLGGDARQSRACSPRRLRASQQESPSKVGIFPLTNRSATLRAALVTPPSPLWIRGSHFILAPVRARLRYSRVKATIQDVCKSRSQCALPALSDCKKLLVLRPGEVG
ncbi:hypothetical protein LEMLEM_LOCUS7090, partial [Lemmus lemmus]